MGLAEKIVAISFTLIFLYLVLNNAQAFNTSVNGLAGGVSTVDKTLQGR